MSLKTTLSHSKLASKFLSHKKRAKWHDQTLWLVREKRDKAMVQIPEWESLRNQAEQIKQHTLENLDQYLEEFESKCKESGIHVHWAENADEHNEIIYNIIKKNNAKNIIKSKSMLTEECHLNDYLSNNNINVCDTDLGEFIVQLRKESPSHIVLPAIHIKKEEISDLFYHKNISISDKDDPTYQTHQARKYLRKRFIQADVGITGVNFAVAETGSITICTNEGNADLGTNLPKIHIACMGIEKIIPKWEHLGVFIRLLARSATGQPITTYTSHFRGPRNNGEMHIVVVDNGRSRLIQENHFKKSLTCIRCGACMNTCPIYRRSGGHSYSYMIPGPIGSVLAPNHGIKDHKTMPFASTLCGSCTNVCPVKINLHEQLLLWRDRIAKNGGIPFSKKLMMKLVTFILSNQFSYSVLTKIIKIIRILPHTFLNNPFNKWTKGGRIFPQIPKQSFKEMYKKIKNKS